MLAAVVYCALLPVMSYAESAAVPHWRSVGPGGGGWIQSIACDPRDPDTLYVGCDVGGYYLSRDAGRTWTIHNTGLNCYYIECIAIHPQDSRILLLGSPGGVFKSTDQGMSWQWKRSGFPEAQRYGWSAPIGALCFDPTRPNVLYAGIGRPREGRDGKGQVYKSEDCGETWRLITQPGVLDAAAIASDLEVSSDGKVILYATNKGLYRSEDGGATWQLSIQGLPHGDVREVAFAPSNPQAVYCTVRTTARDGAPFNGGVYRSDDGGRTWQPRSNGLAMRVGRSDQPPQMTSNYKEIVVDPRDPDTVYVGDCAWVSAGVSKSTDGGRTWTRTCNRQAAGGNMEYGWITMWGPSVECLALCPARPQRLVFGTSGHVFLSDDGAATWQQRYCRQDPDGRFATTGLEVTCPRSIVADPHVPAKYYFGYMDIGLLISEDSGFTFRRCVQGMKFNGTCFGVTPDPAVPGKVWACTGNWAANDGDVCRSLDGGATWTRVGTLETGLPNGQTRCLLVDPTSPAERRTLYVLSNGNGVFRSDDDGVTWRAVNEGLPQAARGRARGLVMDGADPRHLIVALAGAPSDGAGLYETRDGAAHWQELDAIMPDAAGKPAPLPVGDVYDLQATAGSLTTLYLCQRESWNRSATPNVLLPGGLLRSTDGGKTWARVYDFHFTHVVAINPTDPKTVYVGTTDHPYHDGCRAPGIFESTDGGSTWRSVNGDVPNTNISCILVDPRQPSRLWIGTGGNGCFVTDDIAAGR